MDCQNPLSDMKCQGAVFCACRRLYDLVVGGRSPPRGSRDRLFSQPVSKMQLCLRGNLANTTPLQ